MLRHSLSIAFVLVGFVGSVLAQSRNLTETAAADWARFSCSRNADASVECSGCVIVSASDGTSREECSATFKLGAAVNINRANALGDAVRARALRRFGVDGGAP